MLSFRAECPHCHSKCSKFCFGYSNYIMEAEFSPDNTDQEKKFVRVNGKKIEIIRFSLAAVCNECHKPIVATCRGSKEQYDTFQACCKSDRDTLIKVEVLAVYPQPVPPYSHPSLPETVNDAFVDLQRMLQDKLQPHFIIMGCRTVLENAVRELGSAGNTLAERIDDLLKQGVITASLHDWATIIRRHGNAAAHEMVGTEEEATELVNFTKVFLQFTFELPATIQAQRK